MLSQNRRYWHIAVSLWTVIASWLAVLTLVVTSIMIEELIDPWNLRDRPPTTPEEYIQVCVVAGLAILLLIGPICLYWRRRSKYSADM